MKRTLVAAGLAIALRTLAACGGDTPDLALAQPDFPSFEATVYPVLMRDCSFVACHGSSERFFQVFGPGRARLDPMMPLMEPATAAEVLHAYNRALSMIDAREPSRSLLLRKPLTLAAGGAGHEGVDAWMRAIYVSRQDPSYVVLEAWVLATPRQ
jgi:hypothetical protein